MVHFSTAVPSWLLSNSVELKYILEITDAIQSRFHHEITIPIAIAFLLVSFELSFHLNAMNPSITGGCFWCINRISFFNDSQHRIIFSAFKFRESRNHSNFISCIKWIKSNCNWKKVEFKLINYCRSVLNLFNGVQVQARNNLEYLIKFPLGTSDLRCRKGSIQSRFTSKNNPFLWQHVRCQENSRNTTNSL